MPQFCSTLLFSGMLVAGLAALGNKPERVISSPKNTQDLRPWEPSGGELELSLEPRVATDVEPMMKLAFYGGRWPGIVSERVPRDWSPYEVLSFFVWSASPIALNVRIDDADSTGYATRYNRANISLLAGRNLIQIPMEDIAGSIDVQRVRRLVLFLSDPPSGLTLYFEDIRLGGWRSDKIPFIAYEDRHDHIPNMEIVTPHFPAGRGLAGGPVRAFILAGIRQGREMIELMQRMDYDVPAGEATPIALLPYRLESMRVSVERCDEWLRAEIGLQGPNLFPSHVLRVEVLDENDAVDRFLTRNVVTEHDGTVTVRIPLALEDAARGLGLRVTDALTGNSWQEPM